MSDTKSRPPRKASQSPDDGTEVDPSDHEQSGAGPSAEGPSAEGPSAEGPSSEGKAQAGRFLEGQCLIAMPGMPDPRFEKSVVYLCAHSEQGAMGLIVNQQAPNVTFEALLDQLNIEADADKIEVLPGQDVQICVGGPVESGRGFVLHSADYHSKDNTLAVDDETSLTATIEILRAIASGAGPRSALLALGYAGWSPGQLEREINRNGWLTCKADNELLFATPVEEKYTRALAKLGVDEAFLSSEAGRA